MEHTATRFLPAIFIIACCLCLSNLARAADIRLMPESTPDFAFISVSGQFLPGDEKVFANIALQVTNGAVALNSPGGNVIAAIEIGKAIRIKEFSTLVGQNVECASACGLVWLAGNRRYVHPDARIGFHAAYETQNGEPKESGWGNALVGAYLNQLGLPQSAIYYLTSTPPEGMQWLPLPEARSLGIDLEIVDGSETVHVPPQTSDPQIAPSVTSPLKQVKGYDVFGFDLPSMPLKSVTLGACNDACASEVSCKAYTYNIPNSVCFLKGSGYRVIGNPNAVAGYKVEIEAKLVISPITVIEKTDLPGGDYNRLAGMDFEDCVSACEGDSRCAAFTFVRRYKVCWLKSSVPASSRNRSAISGVKLK
jgi:hypothetical protein